MRKHGRAGRDVHARGETNWRVQPESLADDCIEVRKLDEVVVG